MSTIEALKAEAAALQARENALGRPMKHCAALEQVAKNHGYASWRACCALLAAAEPAGAPPPAAALPTGAPAMRRYENAQWGFALDLPATWNAFPPVSTNSPYEVIRFASQENGDHLLIVFRLPYNPQRPLREYADRVQAALASNGFDHFTCAEATLGTRPAQVLDYDKPRGDQIWTCRQYLLAAGTLAYGLGFGTTAWSAMRDLYARMARSFEVLADPPAPA
jgi:hypothetical protein